MHRPFVCFSLHAFTLKKHTTQASSVWIKNNYCLLRLSSIPQLLRIYSVQGVMHGGMTLKWPSLVPGFPVPSAHFRMKGGEWKPRRRVLTSKRVDRQILDQEVIINHLGIWDEFQVLRKWVKWAFFVESRNLWFMLIALI